MNITLTQNQPRTIVPQKQHNVAFGRFYAEPSANIYIKNALPGFIGEKEVKVGMSKKILRGFKKQMDSVAKLLSQNPKTKDLDLVLTEASDEYLNGKNRPALVIKKGEDVVGKHTFLSQLEYDTRFDYVLDADAVKKFNSVALDAKMMVKKSIPSIFANPEQYQPKPKSAPTVLDKYITKVFNDKRNKK